MIQIHIPSYQNLVDRGDGFKEYTAFDIHVNGAYHASVRYSHLFALHNKLIENFGFRLSGPEFPPKKLFRKLDDRGTNERREGLAKYFQGLIQIPDIARHHLLERAFLEFQVRSFTSSLQTATITIHLPDGSPVEITASPDESTFMIMRKLAKQLNVSDKHMSQSFGLFLAIPRPKDASGDSEPSKDSTVFNVVCLRWLKNFESPFISQKLYNSRADEDNGLLVVRRVIWDATVEDGVLGDRGAARILYLQAKNDIENGFFEMKNSDELVQLENDGDYKGYVELCHRQPGYGFEVLFPVISDYPSPGTNCDLKVGRRMIVLTYSVEGRITQALLKSTRIRTWKISSSTFHEASTNSTSGEMTFQVEYVLGSGVDLMTFKTTQAVLISLFLQSIADEILRDCRAESPTYKFDDSIPTRVISHLKAAQAQAQSSKSDVSVNNNNGTNHEHESTPVRDPLLNIVCYQMPFDNENFDDVTDADL